MFDGVLIDDLVGHKINKDSKADWWLPDKKGGTNNGISN